MYLKVYFLIVAILCLMCSKNSFAFGSRSHNRQSFQNYGCEVISKHAINETFAPHTVIKYRCRHLSGNEILTDKNCSNICRNPKTEEHLPSKEFANRPIYGYHISGCNKIKITAACECVMKRRHGRQY